MKIFLIAGETSGDIIGGRLINALKAQNSDIELVGIGGEAMIASGLPQSLFSMQELSLMGIFEILPNIPRLLKRIKETATAIEAFNPDVVVSIDAPDFSFRVHKALQKNGKCNARRVHYVAPTVWAWRPGRAQKISAFLDGLICLFPFEPEYFTRHGLSTIAVGHSLVEEEQGTATTNFRDLMKIEANKRTVGLFFGSRSREVASLGPILADVARELSKQDKNIEYIVPTLGHIEYDVRKVIEGIPAQMHVLTDPSYKKQAMAACDTAIAVSGTVGLELAYEKVPHVIGYKMNALTALLAKYLVKTPYAHLANILLKNMIVPEFIQENCTPQNLSKSISALLNNASKADAQKEAFQELRHMLGADDAQTPSAKAAEFILNGKN